MGRRTKPGLNLETNLDEGYAALGFAYTMTKQINTKWYMSDVIELAHAAISKEFDSVMSALAASNPDRYRHVYEPGKAGMDQFKLWENKLYGRGSKREASFQWIPSRLPILTPAQRARDASDPMSKVPRSVIGKLSDRKYVFRMQAPIMEYNLKVAITPKNAKFLFIPTFSTQYHRTNVKRRKDGARKYAAKNYRFEKYNIPDWNYRNPQEPSGQGSTVGQFTTAWVGFWNGGGAEQVWDTEIAPRIEKGLSGAEKEIQKAARMNRARKSSVELSTFSDSDAAFEAGANLARAFIRGKAASYRQAAKYIEERGLFGNESEY